MNFSMFYSYRKNFKQVFDNIENFIFNSKSISHKIFDRRKIPYKTLSGHPNEILDLIWLQSNGKNIFMLSAYKI